CAASPPAWRCHQPAQRSIASAIQPICRAFEFMPLFSMKFLTTILVAIFLPGCERYKLDAQMNALCKNDGGIKVYEVVKMPPEMFNLNGDPFSDWRLRDKDNRLGPGYKIIEKETYLKKGEPLKGQGQLV